MKPVTPTTWNLQPPSGETRRRADPRFDVNGKGSDFCAGPSVSKIAASRITGLSCGRPVAQYTNLSSVCRGRSDDVSDPSQNAAHTTSARSTEGLSDLD
jgi:hypothetical protein